MTLIVNTKVKIFKSNYMPLFLLAIILLATLIESSLSLQTKQILLGISLSIKEFIIFLLPFVIFSLLFIACTQFSQNATRIILYIIILICISNLITTTLGCVVGMAGYMLPLSPMQLQESVKLNSLFILKFPHVIGAGTSLILGILTGIVLSKVQPNFSKKMAAQLDGAVRIVLKIITCMLPIFIFGFLIKLKHDRVISLVAKDYVPVFVLIVAAKLAYILFLYGWAGSFRWSTFCNLLGNMLPPTLCGFCTMSSAATLPISLSAVEKCAKNKPLVRSIMSLTVNIHLIGNNFTIPVLAFALLKSYGMAPPPIGCVLLFIVYAIATKFSVVAVPGGGIIVMLPILEKFFGFDGGMCAMMFAIYLLFNPILTATNILANGALALVMEKWKYLSP